MSQVGPINLHLFWCWRRTVASVLLVTFTGGLLTPVFATVDTQPAVDAKLVGREHQLPKPSLIRRFNHGISASDHATTDPNYVIPAKAGIHKDSRYQPYLKVGGAKYFNQKSKVAGIYDLFIPLLQTHDQLLFTDLRIFDRNGSSFEGNVHLGYRIMDLAAQRMFGLYGAFDAKKSSLEKMFHQLTVGFEYWQNNWFIGGNFYRPIGRNEQQIKEERQEEQKSSTITDKQIRTTKEYEKSLPGFDAELGYAFTNSFTGYIGGYYFHSHAIKSVVGPKLRLTYDYQPTTQRMFGILDGVTLEAGAEYDSSRKFTAYLGLKLKVGLTNLKKTSNLSGFERHMVELVRRDPDIVVGKSKRESIVKGPSTAYYDSLDELLKKFGLPKNATVEDVKARWRELALRYHPDRNKRGNEQFIYYTKLRKDIVDLMDKQQSKYGVEYTPPSQPLLLTASEPTVSNLPKDISATTPSPNIIVPIMVNRSQQDPLVPEVKAQPNQENSRNYLQESFLERSSKGLNYVVDQFFSMLLPIQPVSALEEPTSTTAEPATFNQEPTLDPNSPEGIINLVTTDQIDNYQKEALLDQLASELVAGATYSSNTLDRLATLIPYDNSRVFQLAKALVLAYEASGQVAGLDALPYFEQLPYEEKVRERFLDFISHSLEKLLANLTSNTSGTESADFTKLIERLQFLLDNLNPTPPSLMTTIFKLATNHYFTEIIVNLLATTKQLPKEVLPILNGVILNISQPKLGLLIALRLTDHHQTLSDQMLERSLQYLSTNDIGLRNLAVNLYHASLDYLPPTIRAQLISALITILPTTETKERLKIIQILQQLKLDQPELASLQLQSAREVLATQNRRLLANIASDIAIYNTSLTNHWSKEDQELLPFLDNINSWWIDIWRRYITGSVTEIIVGNGEILLLNRKQRRQLHKKLAELSWGLASYFQRIGFTDFREIDRFLAFAQKSNLSEPELKQAIASGEVNELIKPSKLYGVLLKHLIIELEKKHQFSIFDSQDLRDSIAYLQTEWPLDFFFTLLNKADGVEVINLIATLNKLKNYHISPGDFDRVGLTATEILSRYQGEQLFTKINQLIQDSHFTAVKEIDELFSETQELHLEKAQFLKCLADMEEFRISQVLLHWTDENYTNWRQTIEKIDDDNIAQVLAVLSQAAYEKVFHKSSYPRSVQLLEVLDLLKATNWGTLNIDFKGWLAQIGMGEGKTIVIAMLAAILAMNKRKVDIISSYDVLAIRDAKKLKDFYGLFGISVSHNFEDRKNDEAKACYKSDIVYGDVLSFSGDTLWDITEHIKFGRWCDVIIVDEADSVVVDQNNLKTQLSRVTPGGHFLNAVLLYIWGQGTMMLSNLRQEGEQCYFKLPSTQDYEPVENASNCLVFVRDKLTNYTLENLFMFERPKEHRIVPPYLEEFAQTQLSNWLDSLFFSYHQQEKVNYIIEAKEDGAGGSYPVVVPIDIVTAAIQRNLYQSDGLHQFLLLKHKLPISPENIVTTFRSYPGYINDYDTKYGFSATLDPESLALYYSEVFKVGVSVFPPYVTKMLVWFPPVLTDDEDSWQKAIVSTILRRIQANQRAGLVILKSIAEVDELVRLLKQAGYDETKIFIYGTGNTAADEKLVARNLEKGEVIIATYLAGRGTDLKLTKEVLKNGGLHVILGTFPENLRVALQAFNRAARQGEPGSAEYVLNLAKSATGCRDIHCLEQERDKVSREKFALDIQQKMPYSKTLDEIYLAYVELVRELSSPTGYHLIIGPPPSDTPPPPPFTFYLYLDQQAIMLRVVNDKEQKYLNITELITTLESSEERHLRAILANPHSTVAHLSKQSYELIHFIAAKHGYIKNSRMYRRIASDSEFFKDPLPLRNLYLSWLKYRESHNNDYEIMQLNEYLGIWLKKQAGFLFNYHHSLQNSSATKENIFAAFQKFVSEMRALYGSGTFIRNPHYLVLKGWRNVHLYYQEDLKKAGEHPDGWIWAFAEHEEKPIDLIDEAIEWANRAIELDQVRAWSAYNVKSYLQLIKDSQNLHYDEDEERQVRRTTELKKHCYEISELMIEDLSKVVAGIEAQLGFLLAHQLVNYQDKLVEQLLGEAQFYQEIIEIWRRNQELILDNFDKTHVAVRAKGDFVDLAILSRQVNVTKSLSHLIGKYPSVFAAGKQGLNQIDKNLEFSGRKIIVDQTMAAGGYVFELETYKVEKPPKDWGATIFAGLMSIIMISVSLMMPATSIFAKFISVSLFTQGVGDLISTAISLASGHPLDFGNYLKSKGIAFGVTLATAGILQFVNSLGLAKGVMDTISKVYDKMHSGFWKYLGAVTAVQAGAMGISVGLNALGKQMVDEKSITSRMKDAIKSIVSSSPYHEILHDLFATNKFYNDNDDPRAERDSLKTILYDKIGRVITNYLERFGGKLGQLGMGVVKSVGSTFINGVTGTFGFGVGSLFQASTDLVQGAIKNAEAVGAMTDGTKKKIQELSNKILSEGNMMEIKLKKDFGNEIGAQLAQRLELQGYLSNGKIVPQACGDLSKVELYDDVEKYKRGIVDECEYVRGLFKFDYSQNYQALEEYFTGLSAKVITSIRKDELVKVGADALGNEAAQQINKFIQNKIAESKNNQEKVSRQSPDVNKLLKESGATINRKADVTPIVNPKTANLPKTDNLNPDFKPITEPYCINGGMCVVTDENFNLRMLPPEPMFQTSTVIVSNDGKLIFLPRDYDTFWRQPTPKEETPQLQSKPAQAPLAAKPQEGLVKPTIELVVRDVIHKPNMKHGFTIFTYSDGRQSIIAGYPEGHDALSGDLQAVDVPYIETNARLINTDWAKNDDNRGYAPGDYRNSVKHKVITTIELNNDQELENYLSKAREAVKFVETGNKGGRFDYDFAVTDESSGENSNTVQRLIWDTMGLKMIIPPDVNMPGIDGDFYDGPMDEMVRGMLKALQEPPLP